MERFQDSDCTVGFWSDEEKDPACLEMGNVASALRARALRQYLRDYVYNENDDRALLITKEDNGEIRGEDLSSGNFKVGIGF